METPMIRISKNGTATMNTSPVRSPASLRRFALSNAPIT